MRLWSRPALVLALLLSVCGTTGPTLSAEDPAPGSIPLRPGEFDSAGVLPDAPPWGPPDPLFERRFVDVRTGRPVAGVTVQLFSEVPHPEPGPGSPLATVVSGPDGVARIRRAELDARLQKTYGGPHLARAHAAGYASVVDPGYPWWHGDWELQPAERTGVTVVDELDRPVEGVWISWILPWGYLPGARQARTDAQGRVWFEDVARSEGVFESELWIVKPGYAAERVHRVPEPDEPILLRRARDLHGVVLAADGQPVAGAAVGAPFDTHGPWTRTDTLGRFVLVGVPEDYDSLSLYVELEESPIDTERAPFALRVPLPPRDRPVTLRLPLAGAERKEPAKGPGSEAPAREVEATMPVTVELRLGSEPWRKGAGDTALAAEVVLQRRLDGRTFWAEVDAQGTGSLRLPAGVYDVLARAWQEMTCALPCTQARGELAVAPGVGATLSMTLPVPRAVRLRLVDESLSFVRAWLHARGRTEEFSVPEEGDFELLVPAEGTVGLTLEDRFGRHSLALDPARQETLELRMPRRELRARLVNASGREIRGWLFPVGGIDDTWEPAGTFGPTPTVVVRTGTWVTRVIAVPGPWSGCGPVKIPLLNIAPGDEPLDLGTVRLPAREPVLRLRSPDGKELEEVIGEVRRHGQRMSLENLLLRAPPDQTAVVADWRLPGLLDPGDVLRVMEWTVSAEPGVHVVGGRFEARLEGPGPWDVRPPTGALELALTYDSSEGAGTTVLLIDLYGYERIPDGALVRVLGLAPGAHELVLRRKHHVDRLLRLISVPDEVRRVEVHLRAE